MKKIILLLVLVLMAGCAIGNKYDYRASSINLPVKSETHSKLVLSVEDSRSYVQQGDKKANFVGLQRGGFGNPFNVTTKSGNPLSEDMAVAITTALENAGYQVICMNGLYDKTLLMSAANENGASRIVILTVNEWKSDIYMNMTLHCDVALRVCDVDGNVLAENSAKFVDNIGGAHISQSKNSEIVADEFAKRVGYLFNKKEIRDAL